jgi:hypothetical protein
MTEENEIIRVFARRTSMSPDDDLAFFGPPPLFDIPDLPVCVSVTFSWDLERGFGLLNDWQLRMGCGKVKIGGPAFLEHCKKKPDFIIGRFLKEGITITSRGCPKRCKWCLVPKREGNLREINIAPGHIVQDNNLLACSRQHIEKVFDMLKNQHRVIQFKGGLDIDYLEPWHIELLKTIKIGQDSLWVACDREKDLSRLDKAADLFADYPIDSKRCYVLLGFNDDSTEAAERRCEKIYEKGFLPFAQYYQPNNSQRRVASQNWRCVVRKWSRPAAYRGKT